MTTKLKSLLHRAPKELHRDPEDRSLIAAINEARSDEERRRILGL